MTERTITSEDVRCPKCYSKKVTGTRIHVRDGGADIFSAVCDKGHKLITVSRRIYETKHIESTEVPND